MSDGMKALDVCAVGAVIGAGITRNWLGAAAGCVIGVAYACGADGDKKLPALPPVGDTDQDGGPTDRDASASVVATDAGSLDGGTPDVGSLDGGSRDAGRRTDAGAFTDAGAATDAGTDAGTVESLDGGSILNTDAGSSEGADAGSDAGTPETPVTWDVSCHVSAEDSDGFRYLMLLNGHAVQIDTTTTLDLDFQAAAGTDAALMTQRQQEAATTWPKDGQSLPDFAQNLVARYQAIVGATTLTLRSRDTLGALQENLIAPMTWESESNPGSPEPIEASTANEIYPASSTALELGLTCNNASCDTFRGAIQNTDSGWSFAETSGIQVFNITCSKVN